MEKFVQIYFDADGFVFDSEPFALIIDYPVLFVAANLVLALKVRKYLLKRKRERDYVKGQEILNGLWENLHPEEEKFNWEEDYK